MAKKDHAAMTPATSLPDSGERRRLHRAPYEYLEHGGAQHSAQVLGSIPFTVVKTLVMEDEKARPLLVLMHGNRTVSTKNLARQIGAKSGRALQAGSGQPPQRLPGGRHLALRHAQADAGVHRGDILALPASCSMAAGAATWSASRPRCACGCSAPSRYAARSRTTVSAARLRA
jgi:hypothetical protein